MNKKYILVPVWILLGLFGINHIAKAETIVNLTIRSGENIIFEGEVMSPESDTITLTDNAGNPHEIDTKSVLAILATLDQTNENFEISNLEYFSSFGSLYLKCLTYNTKEDCDLWQYVVNGETPQTGMDQNILSGGENVYVYFSNQSDLILDKSSITENQNLTATALRYDYENNSWVPRQNITIGLVQDNPDDPWNPIEITTQTVDDNGQAIFTNITPGNYKVGVKEDFYFPLENITVTKKNTSSGGGGGSTKNQQPKNNGEVLGATVEKIPFNTNSALNFLIANQSIDGSFGEDIYTDWVALALSNTPLYKLNISALKQYFINNKPAGTLLTDYERRSMAIMALGLNPYDVNGENYINKIVSSFDGQQFGDINEDNDDIFALIVLQNAGYKSDEKMIEDDINFILNRQKENGSWDESIDMTGATLQALNTFSTREDVKNAIQKAKKFLEKTQKDTGGWNNISSTSWAWGGLNSIKEKEESWINNGLTPSLYLGANQDTDGGIKNENLKNKIWETAYALTAMSGKSWNDIMEDVPKNLTNPKPISAPIFKTTKTTTTKKNPVEVLAENTLTNPTPILPIQTVEKKSWLRRLFNF